MIQRLGIETDYFVDVCINGEEAIDYIKSACFNGISYGLIIMDYSMPVMDGLEATNLIRNFFNNFVRDANKINQPKILGVTGHVSDDQM